MSIALEWDQLYLFFDLILMKVVRNSDEPCMAGRRGVSLQSIVQAVIWVYCRIDEIIIEWTFHTSSPSSSISTEGGVAATMKSIFSCLKLNILVRDEETLHLILRGHIQQASRFFYFFLFLYSLILLVAALLVVPTNNFSSNPEGEEEEACFRWMSATSHRISRPLASKPLHGLRMWCVCKPACRLAHPTEKAVEKDNKGRRSKIS